MKVLYGINAAEHSRVLPTEKGRSLNIAGLCGCITDTTTFCALGEVANTRGEKNPTTTATISFEKKNLTAYLLLRKTNNGV